MKNSPAHSENASQNNVLFQRNNMNKTNIVAYARVNYNRTSPASGGAGVPYYDFSKISGNYDCTNFVSHALLAGGANVYKPSGASGISSTGWYYQNLSNRSSSWSGVQQLHDFLTTNKTKGPYGVAWTYTTAIGWWVAGDVFQFHNGERWRHSAIITGYINMDDRREAVVTGRTSPTQYNNNQRVTEIYPTTPKRTISIVGTY